MSARPAIVWFRLDLRLADQPALHAAIERGGPVIPLYIHSPEEEAPWQPGGASRWWLHQALQALDADLQAVDARLLIRRGPALATLRQVIRESGADAVFWNRRYEPAVVKRDQEVKDALRTDGLLVESYNGALLNEPWTIQNQSGRPFQVFTPFWRHCLRLPDPAEPLLAPATISAPKRRLTSVPLDDLQLEPAIDWAKTMRAVWQPGAAGARTQLERFLAEAVLRYDDDRNRPDLMGTSRLSPHLHFGEISPRQVWQAVRRWAASRHIPAAGWRTSQFLTELGWREFAHHLLFSFPQTPAAPLRADFAKFPWRKDAARLRSWQRGLTGYPIVDAGMRELWTTGWMHNRVRMIVASFLVKDLMLTWKDGARWFWDTLVDADLAQNTLGWQWTAGCGADAAPYFRVFNPVSQGQKFDPQGHYVRRWVPELARLPDQWLHQPWAAPATVRTGAGVELTKTYPAPIVDHAIARKAALEAFAQLKST